VAHTSALLGRERKILQYRYVKDRTNYYDGLIGSRICAFDWYQNQWPWMTLNGQNVTLAEKNRYGAHAPEKSDWRYTRIVSGKNIVSRNITYMRIFVRVPLGGPSNHSGVVCSAPEPIRSSRRSPDHFVGWGRGYPALSLPSTPTRLLELSSELPAMPILTSTLTSHWAQETAWRGRKNERIRKERKREAKWMERCAWSTHLLMLLTSC